VTERLRRAAVFPPPVRYLPAAGPPSPPGLSATHVRWVHASRPAAGLPPCRRLRRCG